MSTAPVVCTCRPGATLWLAGPVRPAVAAELADVLRTRHHRRVEVLALPAPGTGDQLCEADRSAGSAVRRVGMIAEILARNGILALVIPAGADTADPEPVRTARAEVRDRHRRAGTAFLEPPARDDATPPTAGWLLALLDEHGLLPPR
ncbi:hypothetical protein [Streptomyces sp. MMG1121]|uniref:hypothetical protein n=1 Tax=Streptomyces sp. MMG1121 TaxID=1415544 RepID=UPI0003C95E9B|nr:hypothetical protein [Streptomyces sp. MMG1121]AGZ94186.1 adenylylsulfate kinase [Streptomyces sp. MMG1121]